LASSTSYRVRVDSTNSDLLTRLGTDLGLLPSHGVFLSFPCTAAGSFSRTFSLTTAAGSVSIPTTITCGTADGAPLDLPMAGTDASVSTLAPTTLILNGFVGDTVSGTATVNFQSVQATAVSRFSVVSPSDLIVTADNAKANQLQLRSQFKCLTGGQFKRQLILRTQFSSAATLPLDVTINCQGVEFTPMTLSAAAGQTASGSTIIKGIKSSLQINFSGDLPTTITQNPDGSTTLNSKYTCVNPGTFSPTLKANIDGTSYTIPVTVTCTGSAPPVQISSMILSGSVGQTATGTSTVTGVKSSITISFSADLPTTVTQNPGGTFSLNSRYICTTAGTFSPMLKTTVDGTTYPVQVTVTCAGTTANPVQIDPITLSGTTGQKLTGISKVRGLTPPASISLSFSSDLPTTVTANPDGTFTLTAGYTCTAPGTFKPVLKVTANGVTSTVPVTITCTGASTVSVTPITLSGLKGQTLTGTSTVKGVQTSLGLSFSSTLPTTAARNADGSYTLTSKFTCATAGTFKPTLTAVVDGVSVPIGVTVTCK
jgi:hypothetical protein